MTDDLAPYRAELAAMDREQAQEAVDDSRKRLRVAEAFGDNFRGSTVVEPWEGLSALHARLRLTERRLQALGGPIERVATKTRQKRKGKR